MSERTACLVPGCRCTVATDKIKPHSEWICAKHWVLIPRQLKLDYAAERRQAKRVIRRKPIYQEYWKLKPGCADRLAAVRMWRRLDQIWDKMKTAAIERAVGI